MKLFIRSSIQKVSDLILIKQHEKVKFMQVCGSQGDRAHLDQIHVGGKGRVRGDGGRGGAGGQERQGGVGDVPGVTQAHCLGLTQFTQKIVVTVPVAWPLVRSVSPGVEKSGQ